MASLSLLKKKYEGLIHGISLVKNRLYVDHSYVAPTSLQSQYELVRTSKFRLLTYTQEKSDIGYCSAPYGGYTAHHCVCDLSQYCPGKKVELYNDQTAIATVLDMSRPKSFWDSIICYISSLLGYTSYDRCFMLDWASLSDSNQINNGELIGVLSAGPVTGEFAIFSPFDIDVDRDTEYAEKQIPLNVISYNFYENKVVNWQGYVADVIAANVEGHIIYGYVVIPTTPGVKIIPGFSGSPGIYVADNGGNS